MTKPMTEPITKQASGVQDLISRIRDQGVKAGRDEADRIIAEAREEAARLLASARTEIDAMRAKTEAKLQADKAATLAALKLAARDTGLELEEAIVGAFERQVKRLVSTATLDGSFLKQVVLVLAGHAAEEYIKDKDIQVMVSNLMLRGEESPDLEERARQGTLAIAREMLREGVELIPADDVKGGARVRIVDENLEIDLTTEAIHRMLLRSLLPRFRAIFSGAE